MVTFRMDITGAVVTADALHAKRDHATYLAGRGAGYLLSVKRNQPNLHTQLAALPGATYRWPRTSANAGTAGPGGAPSRVTSVKAGG